LNEKSSGSRSRKQRLTTLGTRCADHVTLYPQKLALISPTVVVHPLVLRTEQTFLVVYAGGQSGTVKGLELNTVRYARTNVIGSRTPFVIAFVRCSIN